jgi:hypothetical protein
MGPVGRRPAWLPLDRTEPNEFASLVLMARHLWIAYHPPPEELLAGEPELP